MNRPRSSQKRYRLFVDDYRRGQIDDESPKEPPKGKEKKLPPKRREYLREYLRWLRPHRVAVGVVFVAGAGRRRAADGRAAVHAVHRRPGAAERALDAAARLSRLNLAGARSWRWSSSRNLVSVLRDYRQRLLNTRVMLSLRRSLFDRLLHLPLPKLWDMKTGGILSRLTGDVDTTTGLLQMAVVSPAVSVIRLLIAIVHPARRSTGGWR